MAQRKKHRGGVVVDDERATSAGELDQQRGAVIVTRSARTVLEIVLEIAVPTRGGVERLSRSGGKRRAARGAARALQFGLCFRDP